MSSVIARHPLGVNILLSLHKGYLLGRWLNSFLIDIRYPISYFFGFQIIQGGISFHISRINGLDLPID